VAYPFLFGQTRAEYLEDQRFEGGGDKYKWFVFIGVGGIFAVVLWDLFKGTA